MNSPLFQADYYEVKSEVVQSGKVHMYRLLTLLTVNKTTGLTDSLIDKLGIRQQMNDCGILTTIS